MRYQGAKLCTAALLLYLLSVVQANRSWRPQDLPNPQQDQTGICGRNERKSAVCDPDGMLPESSKDELEGLINMIAEGTGEYSISACGDHYTGFQIAVLIIERMASGYKRLNDASSRAQHFARDIHDSWGVGDAACENGVMVFVAVEDRQVQISTGRGAKQVIPNKVATKIARSMVPAFREERYSDALLSAVRSIGLISSGKKVQLGAEESIWAPLAFLAFCCFPCICAGGSSSNRRQRRYKSCKAALRRIDNDTVAARTGAYEASSCPICLEEFSADQATDNPDDIENTLLPTSGTTNPNARSALPCGHSFHTHCINDWVDGASANRGLCPVCRAPVDGGVAAESLTESRMRSSELGSFDDERRFRIRRAHDIYPDFVTLSMMNDYQRHHHVNMETHTAFVRLDPVMLAQARAAGSSGSTFSFGGGSSVGGGGGGASW